MSPKWSKNNYPFGSGSPLNPPWSLFGGLGRLLGTPGLKNDPPGLPKLPKAPKITHQASKMIPQGLKNNPTEPQKSANRRGSPIQIIESKMLDLTRITDPNNRIQDHRFNVELGWRTARSVWNCK